LGGGPRKEKRKDNLTFQKDIKTRKAKSEVGLHDVSTNRKKKERDGGDQQGGEMNYSNPS